MNNMATFFKQEKTKEEINWDAVYQEMLPRVYNFFRYRIGDDALAEDLTSATFEKAWSARNNFRGELGTVSTWIFAIARNVKIDHFRKAKPQVELDALESVVDDFLIEEQSQRRDESRALGALLEELNPRDRELIALKYGADMSNREIAKLTSLSESNIGTILNRAVNKLRSAWEM
jgi:RNA polymerase sigma-70 factor (ECF subfamily)